MASFASWNKRPGSEPVLESLRGRELQAADQILASAAWLARGLGPGDSHQPFSLLGHDSGLSGRASALGLVFPTGRWLLGSGPDRLWSGLRQMIEVGEIRSLLGPVSSVASLLDQKLAGMSTTSLRTLRLYEGHNLVRRGLGRGRAAERSDVPLLTKWYSEQSVTINPASTAQNLVMQKRIWIWEDREPVAMVSHSPATPFGLRLQDVYVPQARRRLGYGRSVVAYAASRLAALEMSPVFLFHFSAEPGLNDFYERLNFRPVASYCELEADVLKAILSGSSRPGNGRSEALASH